MADTPTLMSHEERRKLIEAPISFFSRHQSSIPWGGSAIEPRPQARRPKTPQDQDETLDDDNGTDDPLI